MSPPAPVHDKPLLRGVSHEVAAAFAFAGGVSLVLLAQGTKARIAAAVYAGGLVVLFTASALYHRPRWGPAAYRWMRRVDHAAIYLLIAGSYTPICLYLGGGAALTTLKVVWAVAAVGVAVALAWPASPRVLRTAIYLAMGWAAVPLVPAMYAALGTRDLLLLASGGALYSVGAVIYATRRPDPFPSVFGYHEVFHALVVAAAALHFTVAAGVVQALAG